MKGSRAISWRVLPSAVEDIIPRLWDPGHEWSLHGWDLMVSSARCPPVCCWSHARLSPSPLC